MLFFLFLAIPLIELWLLIVVGGAIGGFITLLWVIFSALLGMSMWRAAAMNAMFGTPSDSSDMSREWLNPLLLMLGGLLLIIPGVITDMVGLLCLFSPTRNLLIALIPRYSGFSTVILRCSSRLPFQNQRSRNDRPNDGRTIDGDWHNDNDSRH